MPDLKFTPLYYNNTQLRDVAEFYSGWFNQQVLHDLLPLEQQYDGLKVFTLDTYDLLKQGGGNLALFTSLVKDFGKPFGDAFAFTDVIDACWTGSVTGTSPCPSPNNYLFWDIVHPTAQGHLLTADYAYCTLASNCPVNFALGGAPTVPEPSTWAMMVLLGSGGSTSPAGAPAARLVLAQP